MTSNTHEKLGISQRVTTDSHQIRGLLKCRYEDFLVNESRLDGTKLDLIHPMSDGGTLDSAKAGDSSTAEQSLWPPLSERSPLLLKTFQDFSEEERRRVEEYLDSPVHQSGHLEINADTPKCLPYVDLPIQEMDKEARKSLHGKIKECLPALISETVQVDSKNVLRLWTQAAMNRLKKESKNKKMPGLLEPSVLNTQVPSIRSNPTPKYLHFTLRKRDRETSNIVSKLAYTLKRQHREFTFAGTKDKRSVSVQRMCACHVKKEELLKVQTSHHIEIGDFEYSDQAIRLGDLAGNYFRLVIRRLEIQDHENPQVWGAIMQERAQQVLRSGFINYFGTQRFGTFETPTHQIGLMILGGDYQEAVDALIGSFEEEAVKKPRLDGARYERDELINQGRQKYLEGDYQGALQKFPKYCHIESQLLMGLSRGSTFEKALTSLPRAQFTIYIHAVQSMVFNAMASYRIKTFGLQLVENDLVLVGGEPLELTAQHIADGGFRLTDVVLPLFGPAVLMPKHCQSFFQEFSGTLNLPDDVLEQLATHKVTGSYRPMVVKPSLFEVEYLPECPAFPLQPGQDMDESRGGALHVGQPALILDTFLPPSAYVTMAIRELCDL